MIYIQKGKEPASLTAYKKQAHAYYDGCIKMILEKICCGSKDIFVRTVCGELKKKK